MTAAELLVKIQAAGTDELKKVATAIESVGTGTRLAGAQLKTFDATLNSLVASGKTYVEALKEMANSQGVLSSSVVSTSNALLRQMGVVEETTAATEKLVGANIAAGAAIRDMTGQSNIRAIENLLSNTLGLGKAFQGLFAFIGVAAVGEELYHLYEKYDPLKQATKELAEENKKLDATYKQLTENIERYIERQARATLGPSAGKAVAAFNAETQRREMVAALADTEGKIQAKEKNLYITVPAPRKSSFGAHGEATETEVGPAETRVDPLVQEQIRILEAKAEEVRGLIREFDQRKKADDDEAAKDKAREDAIAARPAIELKKRQDEELLKVKKELEVLISKEAIGEDAIREKRAAIIEQLQKEKLLRTDGLAVEQKITEELVKQFREKMDRNAGTIALTIDESQEKYRERQKKDALAEFGKEDALFLSDYNRNQNGIRRIGQASDDADDEQIRREAMQPQLHGKHRAEDNPAAVELSSYQAMVAAVERILANDLKRLDVAKLDSDLAKAKADITFNLSEQEWADEERLAAIRKKNAVDLYDLQEKHRIAIAEEQRADLQKYEATADKVFGALTDRKRGPAFELRDMLKSTVISQGRQVFSNVTAPIFQGIGHGLGTITHGNNPGGVLSGTILDPKNAGTDQAAKDTAANTAGILDEARAIRQSLTGDPATSPASPTSLPGLNGHGATSSVSSFISSTLKLLHLGAGPASSSVGTWPSSSGMDDWPSMSAVNNPLAGMPVDLPGPYDNPTRDPDVITEIDPNQTYGGTLPQAKKGPFSFSPNAASVSASAIGVINAINHPSTKSALQAGAGVASNFGPYGALVAAGLEFASMFVGGGPAAYAKKVSDELTGNQFLAPTPLNVSETTNGNYQDFDSHGILRTSALRAVPTVAEPYTTYRRIDGVLQSGNAPGQVTKPFSGDAQVAAPVAPAQASTPAAPSLTIHVHAIDTQSGVDFIMKNHHAVGEALATHLQLHTGRAANEIMQIASSR